MEGRLSNFRNYARLYHNTIYQSTSSSNFERSSAIDLPEPKRTATRNQRLPTNNFSFTCYSNPIPRLPFSVMSSSDQVKPVKREASKRRTTTEINNALTHKTSSTPSRIADNATPISKLRIDSNKTAAQKPESGKTFRHSNLATKKKYKPVALKFDL